MGGSSKGQTTQTSTSEPPRWAAPLFKQSARDAQNIYNSGAGGNVYQGQTVAQFSPESMGGINALTQAGKSTPNYTNLEALAGAPTSSATNLGDMASGKNLLANPYFEDALAGQLGKTAAQVQSQFSGAGRYGSGANNSVLSSELGNIRSNALYNQYNQDVQNMLTANGMIDNSNTQNIQNQLAVGQAGFQNMLTGAGAQIDAGRMLDDKTQQNLLADYQKWTAEDMRDWTRLGLLQSAAAGAAGNYGTNTQTMQQPNNPLATAGGIASLFMK